MTHEKLTPVQRRFVEEYPKDFNGTDAYIRASGSRNRKAAAVRASKLLKLEKIKQGIEMYVQDQLGPHEQELLGNVKFWRDIRDNPEARPSDRLKASEMLAKYQQMFVEKRDYSVTGQVQIVDDIK